MPDDSASQIYRQIIDELVRECRDGQGGIAPERTRRGVWNRAATLEEMPDQHAINLLLSRLSSDDREVIAGMLRQQFQSGVHTALVVLNGAGIEPFDQAYEGTPWHDFVGRLSDWPWPARERST